MVRPYILATSIALAGFFNGISCNLQEILHYGNPPASSESTTLSTANSTNNALEERLLSDVQQGNLTLIDLYLEITKELQDRDGLQGHNKFLTLNDIDEIVDSFLDYLSADVYTGIKADHVLLKDAKYSDFPEEVRNDLSDYRIFIERAESKFRSDTIKEPFSLEKIAEDVEEYMIDNLPEDIGYYRNGILAFKLIELYIKTLDNPINNI